VGVGRLPALGGDCSGRWANMCVIPARAGCAISTARRLVPHVAGRIVARDRAAVWTRDSLRHAGFAGRVPWSQCPGALTAIPSAAGGVYVIFRVDASPRPFLERSSAGRFKGVDPTATVDSLEANRVPDARMIYIGKANHGQLRRRLEEFVGFARG